MIRALLWKELREQRQLVLAAWLLAAVLPVFLLIGMLTTTPEYELVALGPMLALVVMFLIWPVFGAATGATTVAPDVGDGSLHFIFSRPVSRTRIWRAKVVAAAAALILIIVGSTVIASASDYLFTGRLRLFGGVDGALGFGFIVTAAVLFVGSHYCSLFFARPLAAALAGAVVVASMGSVIGGAWRILVRPGTLGGNDFFEFGFTAGLPMAMLGLLGAAWWVFSRGDMLGAHSTRRMAIPLGIVTLVVALLGGGVGAIVALRGTAALAAGVPRELALTDGLSVLAQPAIGGLGTRLALFDVRSGEQHALGSWNASSPVLSTDGGLIAYLHFDGVAPSGGRGNLRVVRADGTADHQVLDWAPWLGRGGQAMLSISPDNRWVVWSRAGTGILLGSIDEPSASPGVVDLTDPDRTRDPSRPYARWSARFLGWTVDGELLYTRSSPRAPGENRTELVTADPATGAERVLTVLPSRDIDPVSSNGFRSTTNRTWAWYPLWDFDYPFHLALIDVRSGQQVLEAETTCGGWGFSTAPERFVFTACGTEPADGRIELRELDLDSGAEFPFAVIDRLGQTYRSAELVISPSGDRVALHGVRRRAVFGTYLVERGTGISTMGGPELVAADGYPLGWLDEGHLVVVSDRGRHLDIHVVDVETGALREVYSQ